MGAQASKPAAPALAQPTTTSSPEAASKPKPCCVCLDEKSKRDQCMLFSNSADPAKECQTMIEQYRTCMKGYGFEV